MASGLWSSDIGLVPDLFTAPRQAPHVGLPVRRVLPIQKPAVTDDKNVISK